MIQVTEDCLMVWILDCDNQFLSRLVVLNITNKIYV